MYHHKSYHARATTQKQFSCKSKLSAEEKEQRKARKKFYKLFPKLRYYQHLITQKNPKYGAYSFPFGGKVGMGAGGRL